MLKPLFPLAWCSMRVTPVLGRSLGHQEMLKLKTVDFGHWCSLITSIQFQFDPIENLPVSLNVMMAVPMMVVVMMVMMVVVMMVMMVVQIPKDCWGQDLGRRKGATKLGQKYWDLRPIIEIYDQMRSELAIIQFSRCCASVLSILKVLFHVSEVFEMKNLQKTSRVYHLGSWDTSTWLLGLLYGTRTWMFLWSQGLIINNERLHRLGKMWSLWANRWW